MKVKIKWVLFTEESPKPHKQLLVWYHYNSMNPEPKIASYIGDGVFIGPAGHKLYYMDISHWSYFDVPEPKGKAKKDFVAIDRSNDPHDEVGKYRG